MSGKMTSLSSTPKTCHICGLPIPRDIVTPTHFLYGTVDHVIPKARGGLNQRKNRQAAHRLCNEMKGNRLAADLRYSEIRQLHLEVLELLRSQRIMVTHKQSADIQQKLGLL